MSLIKSLFGKNASKISETDLIKYFQDNQKESDIVEYKSYSIRGKDDPKAKEDAILKTICALLNTGGGVIVWGTPEKTKNNGEEYVSGTLDPVLNKYEKDSFISKIVQRIIPSPQNILMHEVPISPRGFVYLFEVKESNYKPHQFDGTYYTRLDGQTIKAPHHYIEALMKQVRYPNLEAAISIKSTSSYDEAYVERGMRKVTGKKFHTIRFRFFILNMSGHINEEDVTFTLITNTGKLLGVNPRAHPKRYAKNESIYKSDIPQPVLSYGETMGESIDIVIHEDELDDARKKINFVLLFGGKKSPMKRCDYEFDFERWNPSDPNMAIATARENVLFIDHASAKGFSKSDIIKFSEEKEYP